MKKFRIRVRKGFPSVTELDHRWRGLEPVGLGAVAIAGLEDAGITPTNWAKLSAEDRQGVAEAIVVSNSVTSAMGSMLFEESEQLRRSARRFVKDLFLKEKAHAKINGGFFRTQRAMANLATAVEYRDRVAMLLGQAKAVAKFDHNFYGASNLKALLLRLLAQWKSQGEWEPLPLNVADLAELKSKTPRFVASTVAGRHFKLSAEDIKLGHRRRK